MPSTALAGEDQAVCAKEANLYANSPSYGEGVWTAMSGSAYFDDPKDPKTTIRNLVEGENVLRWTITEGNCSSYDDVIITRNLPEEVFAGNDQIVCSDEVTLAASPATIGTGRWEIVSGQGAGVFQDRYLHNTKVTSLGQGDNVFRWTVSSGDCHVSDEVTIRSSIPTTAFAGADQILCKNQTELGANSADTDVEEGFWQLISGSVEFDEPSSPTTTAINIRRGENIIAWVIDRDGCQSISELKLTNNSPSQPIINSVGSNNQVCSDSVTLYAQAPTIGTGFWSTPSNDAVIVNPEQNQTKVINLKFGTNTFRWTTTNLNCSLSSDIIVTSNLMYVNAGKDTTVNEPTIQLIGNVPSPGTGYWETIAANPDTQIETPDNFSTFVNNLGAGANVFRWNVDYKGCVASDEITVNYIVWPEVDFDASTLSGCPPLEIRFTNKTIGQGAPYIWTLGDGSAPVVQQQVSPLQYTYYETGTYVVTLTATAPGTDNTVSEEKTITVHPTPTASFEVAPEVVYIPGQTVSGYNYSKNIVKSIWDFGDGKDLIEAYAPTYEYSDTGKFNVMLKVINQFDCPDSLTLYDAVHVIKRSRFFFPDAFTPNPFGSSGGSYDPLDRSNDVFYPILADGEVLDYELKVFNRAGVMVFQSNDINIGWDGYYKDKLLPQGVYVYYITGKYNNGEPFKEVGNVLLIVKDY
jgi:gliding motility-associated-like protein